MIMKKGLAIIGVAILLLGVVIMGSTYENQGPKEKGSYITGPTGVAIYVANPIQGNNTPNPQEMMGYVAGLGLIISGGWILLNSKQKKLLDNKD